MWSSRIILLAHHPWNTNVKRYSKLSTPFNILESVVSKVTHDISILILNLLLSWQEQYSKFIYKDLLKQQKWKQFNVCTNLSKYYRASLGSKEFFFLNHINYQSCEILHLILLSWKKKTKQTYRNWPNKSESRKIIVINHYKVIYYHKRLVVGSKLYSWYMLQPHRESPTNTECRIYSIMENWWSDGYKSEHFDIAAKIITRKSIRHKHMVRF